MTGASEGKKRTYTTIITIFLIVFSTYPSDAASGEQTSGEKTSGENTSGEISVDVPECTAAGRHPAPLCSQYYDCIQVMWWWEAQVVNCIEGQAFDITLKVCTLYINVDCQTRTTPSGWTTTSTTPKPTTAVVPAFPVPDCTSAGKFGAPSCSEYYECVPVWFWFEPQLKICVVGQAFDLIVLECISIVSVDCGSRLTTTTSVATPPAPIYTVPTCNAAGNHPAQSCYEYYECVPVWFWYEPQLKVCVIGHAFDLIVLECISIVSVDCGSRLTTTSVPTTPAPIFTVPTCSAAGNHPAQSCYEYYECVPVWFWYEPQLKVCVVGHAFDLIVLECISIVSVDCGSRLTTTTSVATPPAPIYTVPTCNAAGNHPAQSCYEYYECVPVWFWYEPQLKVCVVGHAFDLIVLECISIVSVDCGSRLTTTTSVATPPAPIYTVPTCNAAGNHPAQSCYEYYECVPVWFWYEPQLKVCVVGHAFDLIVLECISIASVDCGSRITTTNQPITKPSVSTPPAPIYTVPTCTSAGRHPAQSCYEYYDCVPVWFWYEPQLKICVVGQAFDLIILNCISIDSVDCGSRITTTVSTTTQRPLPPIVVPSCSGSGKYAAPLCYQYYECVSVWWWWEPELRTCAKGEAFDIFNRECNSLASVNCQSRTTTSVATRPTRPTHRPPPILVPTCSRIGKHPAPSCYQYYECVSVWWSWQTVLKTCPEGEGFHVFRGECAPIFFVDCHSRTTTTAVTVTPTTNRPIVVPKCDEPGRHPAPKCYEYYECVSVWWGFEPQLKSCPEGHAFDGLLKVCYPDHLVNCRHRVTTPRPPLTIVVPTCSAASKHPASNCYQYYECVSVFWWFEPRLKSCPRGFAFDVFRKDCVPSSRVRCHSRTTTTISTTPKPTTPLPPPILVPTCSSASKHPASICYQYYECVPVWWWYEPQLKTCLEGEAFDISISDCNSLASVNCQNRLTTTKRPKPTRPMPRPPPIIIIPTCSAPSKHPAPVCYQYYECVAVWWWFEPQKKTCPPGEAFHTRLNKCYPSLLVDCDHRITTPRPRPPPRPTPSPRPPPPIEPPTCGDSKPSRHPASLCYQYYECVSGVWGWEAQLKTCPRDEGFHPWKKRCVCAELIDCKVPITEPTCDGPGTYPAPKCNQYYDCTANLWGWSPELKTCPDGQGFAAAVSQCVEGFNCTQPLPLPKCKRPGKHPGFHKHEYFECIFDGFYWKPHLKTCPHGLIFDLVVERCRFK